MSGDKHNSRPMLEAIAKRVRGRLRRARKANRETLAELRETGADLAEAKEALKWREFIEWVREEFGLGKSQALNLTKLHDRWDEVSAALDAAEGQPDLLEAVGNVFTVENALKLADLRQKEAEGSAAPVLDGVLPDRKKKETIAARLKRERDSAVAERESAEEYAAVLEARLQESGVEPPPPEAVRAEVARKLRAQADAAEVDRGLAASSSVLPSPVAVPGSAGRKNQRGLRLPQGKQRRVRRPKRPASPNKRFRRLKAASSKRVRAAVSKRAKAAASKRLGAKLHGATMRKLLGPKLHTRVAQVLLGSKARAKVAPKLSKRLPQQSSAGSPAGVEEQVALVSVTVC